jgi:hypothetical protein
MLTATPMYNTYKEIIFMLNMLLMNDKQATITESDIFDKEGNKDLYQQAMKNIEELGK